MQRSAALNLFKWLKRSSRYTSKIFNGYQRGLAKIHEHSSAGTTVTWSTTSRASLNMEFRLSWLIFRAVRGDWPNHAAAGAAPSGWGHPGRFLNQVRMVLHSRCRGRHGEPNVPVLAERCDSPLQAVLRILIRIGTGRIRIIFPDPNPGSVPECSRIRIQIHKLF